MMGLSYEDIISKIQEEKQLSPEDIEIRIAEKQKKLSGLVSKDGAAHILANELGLDLMASIRKHGLKVAKLQAGMRVSSIVKIVKLYEVRSFDKNGRSGQVGSFLAGDDTGLLRVVLWDTNLIKHMEDGSLKEGVIVKAEQANVKVNNGYKEIHLGAYSNLEINPEGVEDFTVTSSGGQGALSAPSSISKLNTVQPGQEVAVHATIVQLFEPRSYEGCEQCNKKAVDGKCKEHPEAAIKTVPILNMYLDDGTDVIRAVAFRDQASNIVQTTEEELVKSIEDPLKFTIIKEKTLGEQLLVNGRIKTNNFFNRNELMISSINNSSKDMLSALQ